MFFCVFLVPPPLPTPTSRSHSHTPGTTPSHSYSSSPSYIPTRPPPPHHQFQTDFIVNEGCEGVGEDEGDDEIIDYDDFQEGGTTTSHTHTTIFVCVCLRIL